MIDIVVSFIPQRTCNTLWRNMYFKTPSTWQCDITQTDCDVIIPFEYFPTKGVEEPLLTCEVYGTTWEDHPPFKEVYKHTIHSTLVHRGVVEASTDAMKFLADLKQFIVLWTDLFANTSLHSIAEIKNNKVSFAEGEDLVVL